MNDHKCNDCKYFWPVLGKCTKTMDECRGYDDACSNWESWEVKRDS